MDTVSTCAPSGTLPMRTTLSRELRLTFSGRNKFPTRSGIPAVEVSSFPPQPVSLLPPPPSSRRYSRICGILVALQTFSSHPRRDRALSVLTANATCPHNRLSSDAHIQFVRIEQFASIASRLARRMSSHIARIIHTELSRR